MGNQLSEASLSINNEQYRGENIDMFHELIKVIKIFVDCY